MSPEMPDLSLRLAKKEDKDSVLSLTKKFIETEDVPYEFDLNRFSQSYSDIVDNHNFLLLLLCDAEDVVGMLIGVAETPLFSKDRVSCEIAWYVLPEFRSKESLKLLDAFEYWSKAVQNCKSCQMISRMDEKLSRLYKIKNYQETEKVYTKWL